MLSTLFGMGAKLRFALWLGDRIVPNEEELKPIVGNTIAGVIAIIACGMFAAAGVMLGLFAVYAVSTGILIAHQTALLLCAAAFILISVLGYLLAKRALMKIFNKPRRKIGKLSRLGSAVDDTIGSFIAGLMTEPPPKPMRPTASPIGAKKEYEAVNEKVVPIIRTQATAEEILRNHPKTSRTY